VGSTVGQEAVAKIRNLFRDSNPGRRRSVYRAVDDVMGSENASCRTNASTLNKKQSLLILRLLISDYSVNRMANREMFSYRGVEATLAHS
jgi:tyrosyl-tRNA synthetase